MLLISLNSKRVTTPMMAYLLSLTQQRLSNLSINGQIGENLRDPPASTAVPSGGCPLSP